MFKSSLSFEIWIEIQGCGRIVLVVLKVPDEDLDWSINRKQKVLSWMRHSGFVVGRSIVEFLSEFFHLEKHCFGFIVYKRN